MATKSSYKCYDLVFENMLCKRGELSMKDEIKSLLENYGANNLDIYPAAWNGIERNDWQDGWTFSET